MLSIRRVLGLILIILLIVPFALWEGSSSLDGAVNYQKSPTLSQVELINNSEFDNQQGYKFLIVGGENIVSENIASLFEQQSLEYSKMQYANWADLTDKDMVIICEQNISSFIDLVAMEAYISNGGKVLFARGVPEYFTDSYINPILGIENKTVHVETDELKIADGFFVVDADTMKYNDFNSSVWISVRKATEVYISEKDTSLPIVYSYNYNQGKSLVVNGTLLDNPNNMGIVSALMCKGLDTFTYPIIGKSLTYLDSISDIAYDDELTMAQYGVNSSALVLDKLMPELISLGLRNNIVYTASLQVVTSNPQTVLKNDLTTTLNIAKQIINYDGEITFSGNFEKENYQINTQMTDDFKTVFPNYNPKAFMINSGQHTEAIDDYILSSFPKTAIMRYTDSLDSVIDESHIPSLSYGLDFEDGEMWTIINNLTSMGLFSHRMDMRKLAGFADDGKTYKDMMEGLDELSDLYKQMTWLDSVTITQAVPAMQSYESLEFTQQNNEDAYLININNFVDNQKLMFYSEKQIKKVKGGNIQSLSGNYYVISCDDSCISITWEEK